MQVGTIDWETAGQIIEGEQPLVIVGEWPQARDDGSEYYKLSLKPDLADVDEFITLFIDGIRDTKHLFDALGITNPAAGEYNIVGMRMNGIVRRGKPRDDGSVPFRVYANTLRPHDPSVVPQAAGVR